ncbi:MAG TPA: efflux RND transporter periplasmic adaptor subunit [Spirochaetia bacterium]|nr:efflux RND transporter periplasmic adaptor subunit [Spirochaetia bacterium]
MSAPRSRRAVMAAAVIAAALLTVSCGKGKASTAPDEKTVTVARAAPATITVSVEYAARIRPNQEIVVSPKIPGRVADVRADVAQPVRRGQVLFTLESKDADAQARQARAALESARANLTRTSDSSLSSQVIQAQAAVDQAQVQYTDARDFADRTDKLFAQGTVSRQQRDDARARADSAKIALDTAKQSLSLIQDKGGPQSTGVASTQVDQAQAASDLAQSQLDNTVITSPLTGVVASRNVDPGELVAVGSPAFVVIDMSTMTAEASVDEAMVQKVRPGEKVPVRADAAGTSVMEGVVDTVSPAPDPRTQGYTVKVRISAPDLVLRPGMLARVSFPVDRRANVLAVPNQALVTESGQSYVYVDAGGVVKKVAVQAGISDDSESEITQGLSAGDLVITEGQSFLNEGDKVRLSH